MERVKRRAIPAAALPEELLQWEILLGLPSKDLLRCGAVCRSWRRLTTDPEFLLARHRRQPSLPLLFFHNGDSGAVHAFDIQRIKKDVRRPVLGFKDYESRLDFTIHASCDGLLLLSLLNKRFYLCNPATRQWCELPDLTTGCCSVAALYPHRPSGEYRVLYWKHTGRMRYNEEGVYHVLTVSSTSTKTRCIGLPVPSLPINNASSKWRWVKSWFIRACTHPPVLLHDCLHWHLGTNDVDDSHIFDGKVVVFDTVVESFRLMQNTMPNRSPHLLEMDGMLGVSHIDYATNMAELWVLRDYKMEVWSLKYRIELPMAEIRGHFPCGDLVSLIGDVVSENGDMLLTRNPISYSGHLFHCGSNGKLLEKYEWQGIIPKVLGLCFKESLIRHTFFQRKDGSSVRVPSFFQGL